MLDFFAIVIIYNTLSLRSANNTLSQQVMPFNVGESVNYVSGKFISAPIVQTVMKNPFYTAILIVLIIVLIILYVFRNVDFEESDESLGKLVLRGSIYMLLVITAIQFLNNRIWLDDKKHSMTDEGVKTVFGGIEKPSGMGVSVKPLDSGAGVVNFNIMPGSVSSDLITNNI